MATIKGTITDRTSGKHAACTVHYGSDRQREEVRDLFKRGRDFFAGL